MSVPQHHPVTWAQMEAEREFERAVRARRRALLTHGLLRRRTVRATLLVHDERTLPRRSGTRTRVRAIPLDAITGTLDPGRAREFDRAFRPSKRTRKRWLRVWMAEWLGSGLPPIDVIQVGDTYAIRDGHHRVSVARARGAVAIDAIVA
jgi:hypothetical protein